MKPNELIESIKKISLVKKVGPRPKIGLDIEPSCMALVEFSGGGLGQLQLKAASLLGIGKNILTNEEVKDPEALTKAISKLKLLSHCNTKMVSINAPGTLVVTKEIVMPSGLEENAWENHARNEAKKLFPGLENNLYMDFTVYESEKGDKKINNMLLIAARKKEMEERIGAISKGGLDTEVVDIDYYALERAYPLISPQLPNEHVDQYIALLNVDTTAMLMNVIHQKETQYTHRQSYNGESVGKAIQQYLDLEISNDITPTENERNETKTANKNMASEDISIKNEEEKETTNPSITGESEKNEAKKTKKLSSEELEKIEVKKPSQTKQSEENENNTSKEEEKKIGENAEEQDAQKTILSYRDQLVSRIEKFVQYYYSDGSHKKLDYIILSGRCAIIPDIEKSINEKIGIKTIIANPFINVNVPKSEKTFIDKCAPVFMLSCGLALRGAR